MSVHKRNKRRETSGKGFFYWMPAILYMILIFGMSSFPAPEPVRQVPIIYDIKIVHIVEYGVLSVLLTFAFLRTTKMSLSQVFWWSVALTVLYGISDEFHQAFVPGRSCKGMDVIGDLVGAVLFQWAFLRSRVIGKLSK